MQVRIIDRIRSPPIQSDRFPHNITALVNTTATFECRVLTDVEPSFFWISYLNSTNTSIKTLEDKVPVLKSGQSLKEHANVFKLWPTDPDKPHILRLTNITHQHEGYKLVLSDDRKFGFY